MLKQWRKGLIFPGLVLCIMATAASACSGAKTQDSAPASAAASASPPPAATKAPEPVELSVSAAASLADSLNEIKKLYAAKAGHVKLTYNFGASGTLQQQIEQGAPVDLFLSAGRKQMDALAGKQLIEAGTAKNLLLNELVLVVPADSKLTVGKIEDVSDAEIKKLAVGTPESVPAGSYAKETLTYYKLWDSLKPKIVLTKDVKQVLSYVETGNTEAGFVYKTDALASAKVKIALTVDPQSHSAIEYPIAIVKAAKNKKEAESFYRYLQTKEAQDVFVKYGFSLPK